MAVFLLAAQVAPGSCANLTFDTVRTASGNVAFIHIDGELRSTDVALFEDFANRTTTAVVMLTSPGGEVETGIAIGRLVRKRGFSTVVVDTCASACALAWLAGRERFASKAARIGFHVAYVANILKQESGLGNALVGLYLGELGLGENVVRYVSAAAPEEMQWLTLDDANALGLRVTLFDAPEEQSAAASKPLRPVLPGLSKPVPGFDASNVARAIRNGLARYQDAGMFGLQESSDACWRIALDGRTLDKVQYCRALDLVGITMNKVGEWTFDAPGAPHFETSVRVVALSSGLLAAGIDDEEIIRRIIATWKEQFDSEFANASR